MKVCYLYHIRRRCDAGDLKKGYVGISFCPEERWKQHKRRKSNPHLSNALDKYEDVEMQVITSGSRSEMLRLETYLRPGDSIGWNTCAGGGDPPDSSSYWKGRVRTAEHQKNLSKALIGRKTSQKTRELLSAAGSEHKNPAWTGVFWSDGQFFLTKQLASVQLGVSHSTVTYRCKKMKKVCVDGKQKLIKSAVDNFPTWKFIPKEQVILIS